LYTPQEKPLKEPYLTTTTSNRFDHENKSINYSNIYPLQQRIEVTATYTISKKQTRNPLMMLNFNRKPIHSENGLTLNKFSPVVIKPKRKLVDQQVLEQL
jgi:hypothetical protein